MPYENPHYLYMKRTAASDHTDTAALSNKVIIYEERLMVYFYDEAGQSEFGQIPSNLYIGLLDQPIAFPLASVSAADGIQSKVCAGIAKLKENFQNPI